MTFRPDEPDSLVPLKPGGDRPPLYCVHPVSGSAYVYTGLSSHLDRAQPVYGFEAPGFDDDRPPLTTIDALAEEYLGVLGGRGERSFRLLGWSMGGALAFELASRLRVRGADVPVLVVIDAAVPHREELPAETMLVRKFVSDLAALGGLSVPDLDAVFAGFAGDAEPGRLLAAVVRAGVLPEEADEDFLRYRYAVYRAHVAALYDYEAPAGYAGPVTVIRASRTPYVDQHWDKVAGTVREFVVPGDHHSIWAGDGLTTIAGIVREVLDAVGPA
jgi:thioesterase domain-containing protein